ncbi:phosphatase PAP2 family protein [Salinibacterium sp.]|uniref:phosphatase PAP2 family protein n=1 Tax=Salinibacterium sp. TaxID=1915057 RepID=UPI00286AECA3|nr:phosphatase PAP2 family protein [Salinibacterium sp.]
MKRHPLLLAVLGMGLIAVCLGGGATIAALGNGPLALDVAWHDFWNLHRAPWLTSASLWLNVAGSRVYLGVVLPTLLAVILVMLERPAFAAAVLIGGLAGAPAVTLLKSVLLRPRPDDQQIPVTLTAYPSGHVSNLVLLLVIAGLLLARPWCWALIVAAIVAMSFSRTYLDVHWLTDTIGGVFLGAGIALVLWAAAVAVEKRMNGGDSASGRSG